MAGDVYPVDHVPVKRLAGGPALCDEHAVDASAHYRQLLQLGREEFLAAAAPAALVRYRKDADDPAASGARTLTLDDEVDIPPEYPSEETLPFGKDLPLEVDLEVYPLAKKPGASFPDRITIGRTSNNDVVIADTSISRLHAYIRRDGANWLVADAGSKNGSWLKGTTLEARKERPLPSRAVLRFGDVDLTFYSAADLYNALGGQA
jgi:FHA domain-containing protein